MRRTSERAQFIPISAMVMFTTVVGLTAVVDIYQVSREKLKVQNLADAAALNIATQMAGSLNKVADLNEWMNHMINIPNTTQALPGQAPNCNGIDPDLPPISCSENTNKSSSKNMFNTKGSAASYAGLVQKINQAQQLFIDTYNNFIGAGTASNSSISSNSSLRSILLADIPELGDPGTSLTVWNTLGGMPPPPSELTAQAPGVPAGTVNTAGMQPLKFKTYDLTVTYKNSVNLRVLGTQSLPPVAKTLGNLLATNNNNITPVGWMEIDTSGFPQIQANSPNGPGMRMGAGARVTRTVRLPVGGSIQVSAQAQAYIVPDSGGMGINPTIDPQHPVFQPTYWVKLAGS